MHTNNSGSLHIPMLFIFLAITTAVLGLHLILRDWKNLAHLQSKLNDCVGEMTLELKSSIRKIERLNATIIATRIAILANPIPAVSVSLRAALNGQVAFQEFTRAHWEIKRAQWLIQRGCRDISGIPFPLPKMSWWRPAPDHIGPKELEWDSNVPKELWIQLKSRSRISAASLNREDDNDEWKAKWRIPKRPDLN